MSLNFQNLPQFKHRNNFIPYWVTDLTLNKYNLTEKFTTLDDTQNFDHPSSFFIKTAKLNAGISTAYGNKCFYEVKIEQFGSDYDPQILPDEKSVSTPNVNGAMLRIGWQTAASNQVAGQDPESFCFDLPSLRFLSNSQFRRFDSYDNSVLPPREPILPSDIIDDNKIGHVLDLNFFNEKHQPENQKRQHNSNSTSSINSNSSYKSNSEKEDEIYKHACYVYTSIQFISDNQMELTFMMSKISLRDEPYVKIPQIYKIQVMKPEGVDVLYPSISLRNARVSVAVLELSSNITKSLGFYPETWLKCFSKVSLGELGGKINETFEGFSSVKFIYLYNFSTNPCFYATTKKPSSISRLAKLPFFC